MAKNGLHLITPTSIAYTGTSATISANGSVSFSVCSRVGLNGVFSADYDNYMVVIRQKRTAASGDDVLLRLMASGVEATSGYTYQRLWADSTSVTGSRTTYSWFVAGRTYGTIEGGLVCNLYGPYLAQPTAFRSVTVADNANAMITDYANTHSTSTSYDGLMFGCGAGSLSGRIAVYGMRK